VDALGGDLAREAQRALIARCSGTNLLHQEALTRKLDRLRAEVAGPDPAPLERLLAERVAACWLHLHHLELLYAQRDSLTVAHGAYFHRSIDRAHARYLAAIKALAQVRKLAVPALQVTDLFHDYSPSAIRCSVNVSNID
jgi:hypothetical protein